MMDDDEQPRVPEGALDLDELEEVEDVPAIPPPRATMAFRGPAPTPPPLPVRPPGVPVVMVPPRAPTPTLRVPSLGGRPPVPRSTMPVPVMSGPTPPPPSVAIPPRDVEPPRIEIRGEPRSQPIDVARRD